MTRESSARITGVLEEARRELQELAGHSNIQIDALSNGFQELAGLTDKISTLASATVDRLESDGVRSVLPKVQALGTTARSFFEDRLNATTGILGAVESEAKLLRQFSMVTRRQAGIALKTSVLTMYTNIEVGRLGTEGTGFMHLAETLAEFSKSLTADTEELARYIDTRKPAIDATRRALIAELPNLRDEFVRIDLDLEDDMTALQSGLAQLSEAPTQFRMCIENIAQQIAQVVSAVQSHDITRQQIEHVEEALAFISSLMRQSKASRRTTPQELSSAYAGLKVQIYQLRSIKATIDTWTSQIRTCIDVILTASASGVAGISPLVLAQEQEVSSKLEHIEQLEREGQGYNQKIRVSVGGRSTLLQLVGEHAEASKSVRHSLHLLSLNSIIEASRLGSQADAVFEIAKSISDISIDWGKVTAQSETAMQDILQLVEHTSGLMEVFSEGTDKKLSEAQIQTRSGLNELKAAATFASEQAHEIQAVTDRMQSLSAMVGTSGNLLAASYAAVDDVLSTIEALTLQIEMDHPNVKQGFDRSEMETLYSSSYSTEIERDVMHAALHGKPLPVARQVITGNSVELF